MCRIHTDYQAVETIHESGFYDIVPEQPPNRVEQYVKPGSFSANLKKRFGGNIRKFIYLLNVLVYGIIGIMQEVTLQEFPAGSLFQDK